MKKAWSRERPPNHVWVEVKTKEDSDHVRIACAQYACDGMQAHWVAENGACFPLGTFKLWRFQGEHEEPTGMAGTFKTKPIEVTAIQFTGKNRREVYTFLLGRPETSNMEDVNDRPIFISVDGYDCGIACVGNWIVKRPDERFKVLDTDSFHRLYDRV